MAQEITQRELRNEIGEIVLNLDRGEVYRVTRNGVPVGELRPIRRDRYASTNTIAAMFESAPPIDADVRADIDRAVDQGATPRV